MPWDLPVCQAVQTCPRFRGSAAGGGSPCEDLRQTPCRHESQGAKELQTWRGATQAEGEQWAAVGKEGQYLCCRVGQEPARATRGGWQTLGESGGHLVMTVAAGQ